MVEFGYALPSRNKSLLYFYQRLYAKVSALHYAQVPLAERNQQEPTSPTSDIESRHARRLTGSFDYFGTDPDGLGEDNIRALRPICMFLATGFLISLILHSHWIYLSREYPIKQHKVF